MTTRLRSKGLWMSLYKSLGAATDDSDDPVCFNKDEALVLITLYVEPIHHTKGN